MRKKTKVNSKLSSKKMSFKFSLLIVIILIVSTAAKSYINSGYSKSERINRNSGNETVNLRYKHEKNNQENVTFNVICQELRALNQTRTRFKRFVSYLQAPVILLKKNQENLKQKET